MTRVLIIGGGFAGCITAQMLTEKYGKKMDITLLEQAPHLGGGCRTFWYGGHPWTLGPRHFLTQKEPVFEFLNKHCPLKTYQGHEFLTYVERDQNFYHFPIHRDEVDAMPDADRIHQELAACSGPEQSTNLEEYWKMSVGPTLYDKFVNAYSKKMWQIEDNKEITYYSFTAKGVALKTGPSKAAWTEAISAFPKAADGYNSYFELATQGVRVHLGTSVERYDLENNRVLVNGQWQEYDLMVSTISPEDLLDGAFGALRWIGRDFYKIVLPVEEVFPKDVYFLYYANEEPFTRIVEYKKFFDYKSPTTLLGLEIPSQRNKLYPYPMAKDQALHQRYIEALPKNVFSIGRLGTYRYLDVGNTIEQCFELMDKI